jgi:hypothetical protein
MADMFDDGSTFLASCGVSLMVKHSDLSERRIEVAWHSNLTMLLNCSKKRIVGFGKKSTTRVTGL